MTVFLGGRFMVGKPRTAGVLPGKTKSSKSPLRPLRERFLAVSQSTLKVIKKTSSGPRRPRWEPKDLFLISFRVLWGARPPAAPHKGRRLRRRPLVGSQSYGKDMEKMSPVVRPAPGEDFSISFPYLWETARNQAREYFYSTFIISARTLFCEEW